MNDKKSRLLSLIDELCRHDFQNGDEKVEECINELKDIYSDDYRHSYTDIFVKIQKLMSESNVEALDVLGDNLDFLKKRLEDISSKFEDGSYRKALEGFNKFSDHINLEIARYNFITKDLHLEKKVAKNTVKSSHNEKQITVQEIEDIKSELEKTKNDFNALRTVAEEARKVKDAIDENLKKSNVSSITTLTIFSAVVLAFSGGITFEAGILQGMSSVSAFRLVFIVALSGFILFNTIFALLYLVGKLSEKPIATKCPYYIETAERERLCRCDKGYCTKDFSKASLWCRAKNKYCYVIIVNSVLLLIMYFDFLLWYSNGNIFSKTFTFGVALILLLLLTLVIVSWIKRCIYTKRNKLALKVYILGRKVAPEECESNIGAALRATILKIYGKGQNDIETVSTRLENKTYGETLKIVEEYSEEQILDVKRTFGAISLKEHKYNKIKWEKYKEKLKNSK